MHFTGDTDPTWDTLAFEAHLSPDEASIGLPYVSDDIGSFKGKHLPDDLYVRWVQLGTFQPVLRLHSDHGDRLPWQYGAGQQPAADALRLREALVPYTYSLDWQAHETGLPITRPLYLDYPALDAAYNNPGEYLYGPDVLVAPVTTPGAVASQTVWFPPGQWVDYFTGATYTGPSTATLQVPLDRMPVFLKAGGIVPEQPGRENVDAAGTGPLELKVYAGGSGSFAAYNDAGDGLGYQHGQYTQTALDYRTPGHGATSTLTIGAARGSYPGAPVQRGYTVDLVDVSAPHVVQLDRTQLHRTSPTGDAPGWWYDAATGTLHVRTPALSTGREHTVMQSGGRALQRPQSAAVALSIDPPTPTTLASGASTTVSTTVTNAGPDAITGARITLDAPAGWTVTPSSASAGTLAAGSSASQSWTVTAPNNGQQSTAALKATVDYTDSNTGAPGSVTTYQGPPSNLPPVISSLDPSSAAVGQQVTIHGTNFGATQADPSKDYVFFTDGGTSWGAPFDGAAFQVNSWSKTAITFTVPEPSGPGGIWHVTPGDTANVSVTTDVGSSNTVPLKITG